MKNGTKTALRRKTGFDGPSPDVGKATQFKPGNPGGGRPRTAKFAEAARQLAAEIGKDGLTGAQKLAQYCFKKARRGSARPMEIFLHYAEGKPAARSEEELFPEEQPTLPAVTTLEIEGVRKKAFLRDGIWEIPPNPESN